MSRVRVESFTVSVDGYGAGLRQTLTAPMGEGGGATATHLVVVRA